MEEKFENLLMDFYELTMGQGYVNKKIENNIAYFDVFFRKVPDGGSFVIANGVEKCVRYLTQFGFTEGDIEYLKGLGIFTEEYLEKLKNVKFNGDMWAVEDGTVIFPNEPAITIKGSLLEAQLVETALLLYFNHASLITTKANRIVRAAQGRAVMEFGSRRAQGADAAIDGAYATYVGGVAGTACTVTGKKFGVNVLGTMAHSFVQTFDTEYEAFKAYAETFPNDCVLLLDTYNTLKSGLPNAIKVYKEVLKPMGKTLKGIRIDSGDLAYISKEVRKALDAEGLKDTKIIVSNSLDEYVIENLIKQGAPIDSFGVGENMITSKSNPVFGGVYKLVAIEKNGNVVPKIKVSDNIEKVTNPHFKKIYRIYDNKTGKFITDYLAVYNEEKPKGKLLIVNQENNCEAKEINDFTAVDLRVKMIENGKRIYKAKTKEEVRENAERNLNTLCDEAKRFDNPQKYSIKLSYNLLNVKKDLLNKIQELEK